MNKSLLPLIKSFFLSLIAVLYIEGSAYAQCPNADFSFNNFTNWQGSTGSCCPINTPTPGIVNGRHTIMNVQGIDPNTCGGLALIPPGFNQSARLGNMNTGANAESLSYTMTVTANNALVVYSYAVVLEDPGHGVADQPRFELQVLDQNNNPVPCTYYQVVAAGNIPGFQNCGNVRWKDWTQVGVDLSGLIGQTITIQASTGDCDLGGHFGYAYIVAKCQPLVINVAYCLGDTLAQLTAPAGFATYSWSTGQTTQQIVITNPAQVQNTITVTITSVTGCQATLSVNLYPSIVSPNFSYTNGCQGLVQFTDSSTIQNDSITGWLWYFGDGDSSNLQNPIHTYNSPGNYNVTLTILTQDGCSKDTIIAITIPSFLFAGFTATSGCGLTHTFTDTSVVVGNGNITNWLWDFGDNTTSNQQNPSHTYAQSGTYTVWLYITSAAGCTDSVSQTITIYNIPIAAFTTANVCDGQAVNFTDNSTNNNDPINTWNWNFGDANTSTQQNPSHTYAGPNTYNVQLIVSGPGPCSDTATGTVTVYPLPNATAASNGPICEMQALNLTSSGGATYSWNGPGGFTSNLQNPIINPASTNNSGSYSVIVTNSFGCTANASVVVNVHPKPNATATSNTPVCAGQALNLSASNGASHSWTGPNSFTSGQQNPTINPATTSASGTYTVIVTSNYGCTDTATENVIINPLPSITINANTPVCAGQALNLQSSGGTTFSWTGPNGFTSNQQNPIINPAMVNATGLYSVVVTDANGCVDSATINATVNPLPVVSVSSNGPICAGQVLNLTSGGGTSYIWSGPNGFNSNLQNPAINQATTAATGSYTVSVTNNNGCVDSASVNVTVNPLPVVTISSNSSICSGQILNLNSGGGNAYSWSGPNGFSSNLQNPTINPATTAATGVYSVTVTDGNGCVDSASLNAIVNPTPVADFIVPTDCGLTNAFTDNSSISNGNIVTWNWNFGDNNTSNQQNPTHSYNNQGTWNVMLSVTSDSGCTDSKTVVFINKEIPVADFTATTVCFGQTSNFTDISTTQLDSIQNWNWNFQTGNSLLQNPAYVFPNYGSKNVALVITLYNGCSDTVVHSVTVHPLPSVDFTFNEKCTRETVQFNNQSTIPYGNISGYNWDLTISNSVAANPTATYNVYGLYPIQLIATSNNGCIDSTTKTLHIHPRPVLSFNITPKIGCSPLYTNFINYSTIPEGSIAWYNWTFGDGNSSNDANPQHIYTSAGTYDVTLTAESTFGCDSTIKLNNLITVHPTPTAEFTFSPTELTMPEEEWVNFNNQSDGASSFMWNFGDGGTSADFQPTYQYEIADNYKITLIAMNKYGCSDTTIRQIEVKEGFTVYIPNSFTPNGDGLNDIFKIYGTNILQAEVLIFDRWGELIYSMDKLYPIEKGWNGTTRKGFVKQDVYVYKASVLDYKGQWHDFRGHINVLR